MRITRNTAQWSLLGAIDIGVFYYIIYERIFKIEAE